MKKWRLASVTLAVAAALLISAALVPAPARSAIVADGRLTANELTEYSHFLSISWQTNLNDTVNGGLLGLGTNQGTGRHFVYYQLPVDYKDNTWGIETTGPWGDEGHQVGEYGTNPHTVRKVWQGDQLGGTNTGNRIVLRPTGTGLNLSASGTLEFNVDLLASSAGAGNSGITLATGQLGNNYLSAKGLPTLTAENNGTLVGVSANPERADYFVNVATSTSWNVARFTPPITQTEIDASITTTGAASGLLQESPEVTTTVDGNNLVNSGFTRLNPADPNSPIIDYDNVDAAYDDWWFPAAFEIELAAALFPAGEWTSQEFVEDLVTGDAGNALLWIPRGGHISPNKFNATAISTPDFEVTTVPIPGAVWLLGSGLIGLVAIRRKKKRA